MSPSKPGGLSYFIVAYGLRCNREGLLLALNQQLGGDGITTCLWPGPHILREEEREDKCSDVNHCVVVDVTGLN